MAANLLGRAGLRTLRQGATIICELSDGPRGPQVANIERVDDSTVSDDVPGAEGDEEKARITATAYTSHVPAIGAAIDLGKSQDAYWKPVFDGYEPAQHLESFL